MGVRKLSETELEKLAKEEFRNSPELASMFKKSGEKGYVLFRLLAEEGWGNVPEECLELMKTPKTTEEISAQNALLKAHLRRSDSSREWQMEEFRKDIAAYEAFMLLHKDEQSALKEYILYRGKIAQGLSQR